MDGEGENVEEGIEGMEAEEAEDAEVEGEKKEGL